MFEIELKAHVENRSKVIEKMNFLAEYIGSVQKDDFYWGKDIDGKKIQARIRRERHLEILDAESFMANINADEYRLKPDQGKEEVFLTYKEKEVRESENGTSFEVNDEKESKIDNPQALEALFKDLGMNIVLEKHKTVISWMYGNTHIELCTVPPLGDFLEIEILTENNDQETITENRNKLLEILKKCDIPESKIEKRYYSEMLREVQKSGENNV